MTLSPSELGVYASLLAVLSGLTTLLLTKFLITFLAARTKTVEDYYKPGKPQVPRPGGPAIIIGIVSGEAILYALTNNSGVLAVALVTVIAGSVGLIDDLRTLGGLAKPAALVLATLPILLLPGAYDFHLALPLFTPVRLPIVYPLLILIAIPVTANTLNTIDVLNGVASGFTFIATLPLLFGLFIKGNHQVAAATLPLLAAALAFYYFHRYPSKIFLGDSGSLALGAGYGALAVTGGAEVVAIIAILPAILNSFFFLSSVRRLVEHREVKAKPTMLGEDFRISASRDRAAPVTLMRLLVADGPLSEKEIAFAIFKLTAFSAILALVTAVVTWWP